LNCTYKESIIFRSTFKFKSQGAFWIAGLLGLGWRELGEKFSKPLLLPLSRAKKGKKEI